MTARGWPRVLWRRLPLLWSHLPVLWRRLREWSGDAAYDTYVARAGTRTGGRPVLDRQAFYLDSLRRRYERPTRCC